MLTQILAASIEADGHELDVALKDKRGCTMLHYAAGTGDVDSTQWLVRRGASVDEADNEGLSALFYAAQSGAVECTKVLQDYLTGARPTTAHSYDDYDATGTHSGYDEQGSTGYSTDNHSTGGGFQQSTPAAWRDRGRTASTPMTPAQRSTMASRGYDPASAAVLATPSGKAIVVLDPNYSGGVSAVDSAGWERAMDHSGYAYYTDPTTAETRWETEEERVTVEETPGTAGSGWGTGGFDQTGYSQGYDATGGYDGDGGGVGGDASGHESGEEWRRTDKYKDAEWLGVPNFEELQLMARKQELTDASAADRIRAAGQEAARLDEARRAQITANRKAKEIKKEKAEAMSYFTSLVGSKLAPLEQQLLAREQRIYRARKEESLARQRAHVIKLAEKRTREEADKREAERLRQKHQLEVRERKARERAALLLDRRRTAHERAELGDTRFDADDGSVDSRDKNGLHTLEQAPPPFPPPLHEPTAVPPPARSVGSRSVDSQPTGDEVDSFARAVGKAVAGALQETGVVRRPDSDAESEEEDRVVRRKPRPRSNGGSRPGTGRAGARGHRDRLQSDEFQSGSESESDMQRVGSPRKQHSAMRANFLIRLWRQVAWRVGAEAVARKRRAAVLKTAKQFRASGIDTSSPPSRQHPGKSAQSHPQQPGSPIQKPHTPSAPVSAAVTPLKRPGADREEEAKADSGGPSGQDDEMDGALGDLDSLFEDKDQSQLLAPHSGGGQGVQQALSMGSAEVDPWTTGQRETEATRRMNELVMKAQENNYSLWSSLTREQEARRAAHEQLERLKGPVRLHARIRPMLGVEMDAGIRPTLRCLPNGVVELRPVRLRGQPKEKPRLYQVDAAYSPSCPQSHVFGDIRPLVQSTVDGFNSAVVVFGPPQGGKTYSMFGPEGLLIGGDVSDQTDGIATRVGAEIFRLLCREGGDIRGDNPTSWGVTHKGSALSKTLDPYQPPRSTLSSSGGGAKQVRLARSSLGAVSAPGGADAGNGAHKYSFRGDPQGGRGGSDFDMPGKTPAHLSVSSPVPLADTGEGKTEEQNRMDFSSSLPPITPLGVTLGDWVTRVGALASDQQPVDNGRGPGSSEVRDGWLRWTNIGMEARVRVNMYEVRGSSIVDILRPRKQPQVGLTVRMNPDGTSTVEGGTSVVATSQSQFSTIVRMGMRRIHPRPPWSHVMIRASVQIRRALDGMERTGRMVLIDMASPAQYQSAGMTPKDIADAQDVALSIHTMGEVLTALAQGADADETPFRDHVLTQMSYDCLAAQKVMLLLTVSPSAEDQVDTERAMRFAARIKAAKTLAAQLKMPVAANKEAGVSRRRPSGGTTSRSKARSRGPSSPGARSRASRR